MNSENGLKQLLNKWEIPYESEPGRKILLYLKILGKWNLHINLTASLEWTILCPLFEEGIWVSRFYPTEAKSHLDIGSGAGFPAVLIRIMAPCTRLEMVESRNKRALFLETVVHELNLTETKVFNGRLDEHLRISKSAWDCITWKGLKLSDNNLLQLKKKASQSTEFWMFHGKKLSVEKPETMVKDFRLKQKKKFPGREDWWLSIYNTVQ